MSDHLDIAERWPELFEELDDTQRNRILETFAAPWHEGWVPNREDVENLTDLVCGAIDDDEYLRRGDAAAERSRTTGTISARSC